MSLWQKFRNLFEKSSSKTTDQDFVVVRDGNVAQPKPRIDKITDFSPILQSENIKLDVGAKTKNEVLKYLADFSQELNPELDSEALYGKFLIREKDSSSDLGEKIAVPHIQDHSIQEFQMIVLKLRQEVKWSDQEDVRIVIAMLIPEPEVGYAHVTYLASIARLILKNHLSSKLRHAKTVAEVIEAFE